MPWENNSGGKNNGPWGSGGGGQGPWGGGKRPSGSGGGRGPGDPPDLEELLRKGQDQLRKVMPGGRGGGGGSSGGNTAIFILVLLVGLAFAGYYFLTFRVQPSEVGVVTRFGEFSRLAPPGLNFRLPYPVEEVYTPQVTFENRVSVGLVSSDLRRSAGQDIPEESLMLTGDENIVDVDFTVVWDIKDAPNFLFNIRNPEGTVKEVAESAMREVVGRSEIQPILTQARQITETAVEELMQQTLDSYQAGINIKRVQLLKVDPPSQVIDAFRDVQAARADNERSQNEAQAYANQVVPQARGQAAQILEQANAYREQTVQEARGQADRFINVYEEYRKAPDVTRQRIYLETLEKIFSGTDKVIIDNESGSGVVPYLPLDRLQNNSTQGGQNR
jgi:membrane protease subunit HflK